MAEQQAEPARGAQWSGLPSPPRAITPRVRRRSWSEAPVRRWMILTIIVGVVAAYFTSRQLFTAISERRLITGGREVEARIDEIGQRAAAANVREGEQFSVTLTYPAANGEPRESTGVLVAQQDGTIKAGDMITIRVDPRDPDHWTNRTRPRPLIEQLTAGLVLLPLLALTVAMMHLRRWQVLRTWRDEPAMGAVVVETRQSSTAPMSRTVRFVLQDSDDRRVFSVLHPSKGAPAKGEVVTVICPRSNPGRAIVAELYQEQA